MTRSMSSHFSAMSSPTRRPVLSATMVKVRHSEATAFMTRSVSSKFRNWSSVMKSFLNLKPFTFGTFEMTSHSAARFSAFRNAPRWLLMLFFDCPSPIFLALKASTSAGPILSSFMRPKYGDR